MWDEEEEDDGLGAVKGLRNGFILMVLIFVFVGTIWGLAK